MVATDKEESETVLWAGVCGQNFQSFGFTADNHENWQNDTTYISPFSSYNIDKETNKTGTLSLYA